MTTKKSRTVASLAAAGRSGKPPKPFGAGIEHMTRQTLQAEQMVRAQYVIAARYGLTVLHDEVSGCAGDHVRYAGDLYALPPELWVSVATEAPRTIARLDKYAQRMRRYATKSGKCRPTPDESREAIARLYGFESYAAAAGALSGKQEVAE